MKILLIEPGKKPVLSDINGSLKSMQEVVGGTIQAIFPFEEPVALICNDEGKLLGLPLNRALWNADGRIYDIVAGTFFLCGAPADRDAFESLTEEESRVLEQRFSAVEIFLESDGQILCIPSDV